MVVYATDGIAYIYSIITINIPGLICMLDDISLKYVKLAPMSHDQTIV